jgi:hypothetical protein
VGQPALTLPCARRLPPYHRGGLRALCCDGSRHAGEGAAEAQSVQSARAKDSGSCVEVHVTTNVTVVVTVDVSVNVTIGDDGRVDMVWQPGTDDTAGWNVYRADGDGSYVKMNDTPISNDSNCHYTDGPGNGQARHYLLESMGSDGQKKPRALVNVDASS